MMGNLRLIICSITMILGALMAARGEFVAGAVFWLAAAVSAHGAGGDRE